MTAVARKRVRITVTAMVTISIITTTITHRPRIGVAIDPVLHFEDSLSRHRFIRFLV